MAIQRQLIRCPEQFHAVDHEFSGLYDAKVRLGRRRAANGGLLVLAIARNCMPHLTNTLALLDQVAAAVGNNIWFHCYENDSTDGTVEAFAQWTAQFSVGTWVSRHIEHGPAEPRPDSRGFEKERTMALAKYRNECLAAAARHGLSRRPSYTAVIDLDPHGGFSVDGLFNSIGWLETRGFSRAGGMGSLSLFAREAQDGSNRIEWWGYDAWAARLNWWRDRKDEAGFLWFSSLVPPIGSPPIRFNSCFGGLGVYRTEAILSGRYDGNDCEHVGLHRSMYRAGWRMYLNPGSRYIAILPSWMTPGSADENSAGSGSGN